MDLFIILFFIILGVNCIISILVMVKWNKDTDTFNYPIIVGISFIIAIILTPIGYKYINANELRQVKDLDQDFIYSYTQQIKPMESNSEYIFLREDGGDRTTYYLLTDGSSFSYMETIFPGYSLKNVSKDNLTIKYNSSDKPKMDAFERQYHTWWAKKFKGKEYKYVFYIPDRSIANYVIHTERHGKTNYTSYIIKRKK